MQLGETREGGSCHAGAGWAQARCRSMCRCGLTGRRAGADRAWPEQGCRVPGWVLVWSGLLREPPSRKQECAINWPHPGPEVASCLAVAVLGVAALAVAVLVGPQYGLFPFLFCFSSFPPCHWSLPPSACGVGKEVRGPFKMRSTKGKRIMEPCKNDGMPPRPKLPCCRSVPWPASMGKWAKEGGQDNLIAHPPAIHSATPRGTRSVAGWVAANVPT